MRLLLALLIVTNGREMEPGSGPGGRRFKSSLPRQFFQQLASEQRRRKASPRKRTRVSSLLRNKFRPMMLRPYARWAELEEKVRSVLPPGYDSMPNPL